jgi:hypothetical protein
MPQWFPPLLEARSSGSRKGKWNDCAHIRVAGLRCRQDGCEREDRSTPDCRRRSPCLPLRQDPQARPERRRRHVLSIPPTDRDGTRLHRPSAREARLLEGRVIKAAALGNDERCSGVGIEGFTVEGVAAVLGARTSATRSSGPTESDLCISLPLEEPLSYLEVMKVTALPRNPDFRGWLGVGRTSSSGVSRRCS